MNKRTSIVTAVHNSQGTITRLVDDNGRTIDTSSANGIPPSWVATPEQAKDGMADNVFSTPESVAQQIATTLPPNSTIRSYGSGNLTGFINGTPANSATAPGLKASGNINIGSTGSSDLMITVTVAVQVLNSPPDGLVGSSVSLQYFDGTNWIQCVASQLTAVRGTEDGNVRIDTSITMSAVLPASARRSDTGAWAIAPFVQSTSGGTWFSTAGHYSYLEIEGADVTTAKTDVEQFMQFIEYGQSLGAGQASTPPKTIAAVRPGRALMPVAGVRPLGNQGGSATNALVKPWQIKTLVDLLEKTDGSCGESPSSAAAYKLTGADGIPSYAAVTFVNHSIGGTSLQNLSQGSLSYQNILSSVKQTRYLARRNGISHTTSGLFLTQGESNKDDSQALYLSRLVQLQASLNRDIRSIDRATEEFPMFIDQLHNWTGYNITESNVPFAQLQAAIENPDKIYLVGPKYMLQTAPDKVHLTADSSAWWGAYQGEVARRVIVLGEKWLPTHIISATRRNKLITLQYHVPEGGLTIDTTLVTDPGSYGFRWIQSGGFAVTIESIAVTSSDTITITLSDIPTGTNQKIGYADIGVSGAAGGPLTGPRGNIRDRAVATGLYGEYLYNWAAVQQIDVVNQIVASGSSNPF